MFEDVLTNIASMLEEMTVDDASVTPGLLYDPRGESFGGDDELTIDMFRRFVFGFTRTCTPDWALEGPSAAPSMWRADVPLMVFYPVGGGIENVEPVSGMALDDALKVGHTLATECQTYFNAHPVTGFGLSGIQTTHDGLELVSEAGLISNFTLTVRFSRSYD